MNDKESDEISTTLEDKILQMAEGVDLLAIQSQTLNERVYTKNYLDQTRNRMFVLAILVFTCMSILIASLIIVQIVGQQNSNRESKKRSEEAIAQRRQFADCQVPPGTPLMEGVKPGQPPYINPGECYIRNAKSTSDFLNDGINSIRLSEDCLYLRRLGIRPDVCVDVNKRVDLLKGNVNPFPPPNGLTTSTETTTSTISRSSQTTMRTSTTVVKPTVLTTVPRTTTTTSNPGLLCSILGIIGLC